MEPSTIALIIIIVTLVFYIIDKLPIALVSLISALAMVLTGVMPFSDAFKGFAGNTFLMVAGMMVLGDALFQNGVAHRIGDVVFRRFESDEKKLLMAFVAVAAVLSGFLHNSAVLIMMMPMMDYYAAKSGGRLRAKIFYMPVAQFIILGTRLSLVGSASPMLAQEVLLSTPGVERGLRFFETAPAAIPVLIILMLCYYFFLYRMEEKVFDLDTVPEDLHHEAEQKSYVRWKMWLSAIVIIVVALAFAFLSRLQVLIPGLNNATVAMSGAVILLLSGCVDFREQMTKLNIETLIIVGCATGFATCFNLSGIGDVVVNWITGIGTIAESPALMVVVFTFVSSLLINLMANSVATATLSALAIATAQHIGMDPIPLVCAVLFGGGCSFLFPTSTYSLTMAMQAGYRFSDYTKIGAVVGVIVCTVSSFMICLLYGLL